jgi:hypothetical protein
MKQVVIARIRTPRELIVIITTKHRQITPLRKGDPHPVHHSAPADHGRIVVLVSAGADRGIGGHADPR